MSNLTQLIERHSQINASVIATVFKGRQQTYKELAVRVARFAGALQSLDCKEGARIAILSLNSDRYFECNYSIPWTGCQIVPLNIRWSVKENLYSLNDCEAEVLIFDDAFTTAAKEILEQSDKIRHAIYFGDGETPEWAKNYEDLIAASDPIENADLPADSVYGIFYTGGTTGFPKGVMLSHQALWSSNVCCIIEFNLTNQTRYLHAAPMFHAADTAMSIAMTIIGGTHVFIPMFDPGLVPKAIAEENIEITLLIPAMLKMMLEHPAIDEYDLSGLQRIVYGGSPMPAAILERALPKLPKCGFFQAYGQTELAPIATILPPEYHVIGEPKLSSAGRASHCVKIKIVDADDNILPVREVGEIVVSGPNVMNGYLNKPEQTAATLKNGWVYTGDAGYLDEDGFVYIADRVKDMIVTGGENVFSAEVENAVASHAGVVDVAVIGIPSEQWGETVHAIVIPREGVTASEEDIIKHCREYIAGYKCPKSVEFRTEPFPLSGAGKVLKTELRKPHWQGKDRQVN